MKPSRGCIVLALALVLWGRAANAHHSFSAVYEGTRVVTLTGVVTQFKFVNPHAMMTMDVTDGSGKVTEWTVEFAGRLNLSEVGWTADSIKAKERVTVTGNPSHAGSSRIAFVRLVKNDGTELLPSNAERLKSVEEERRQRAKTRNQ